MTAVTAKTQEQLKAYLKEERNGRPSMYEHFCSVVGKLLEEKPAEALNSLESLSSYLKDASFQGQASPDPVEATWSRAAPAVVEARQQWAADLTELSKTPAEPLACPVQNFSEDATMFKWAGVGFSQQESYQINLALRRLASNTPGLLKLRFWGKLLGTGNDYLVAEGLVDGADLPKGGNWGENEARGQGANMYTYWVTSGPSCEWTQLPLVTTDYIKAARQVKRLFTGDPETQLTTNPWFPGKEKHLLRAQIARITAASVLSVEGFYKIDEDTNMQVEDPDFQFPAAEDMMAQGKWVHAREQLLLNGRTSYPEVDEENEEAMRKLEQEREMDPPIDLFRSIGEDLPNNEGNSDGWSTKKHGDSASYKFGEDMKCYAVISVKSSRWPGAITVVQGSKHANLYVGYGMKADAAPFLPVAPADVMDEPKDLEENGEPNPEEDDGASDGAQEDEPLPGEE